MSGCHKCYNKESCFAVGDDVLLWTQNGPLGGLYTSHVQARRQYDEGPYKFWCYQVQLDDEPENSYWVSCDALPRLDIVVDELVTL